MFISKTRRNARLEETYNQVAWVKEKDNATLVLFGGWLHVRITKKFDGFEGNLYANWGTSMGALVTGRGKTLDVAIDETNTWLAFHFTVYLSDLKEDPKNL